MSSVFGKQLKVSTFGESHGPALGVLVDGLPAGLLIDQKRIQREMDRRRPGGSAMVSARKEADQVEILSGVSQGKSLGSPIALLVRNKNARSKDYRDLAEVFRPGHADFTYFQKYGIPPQPGGGRASGRETAARVAAGALARALLEPMGIAFFSCTVAVGGIKARKIDYEFSHTDPLHAADPDLARAMGEKVLAAREKGDSVGGVVQVEVRGAPAGWGDPVFDKLDAALAGAWFSIGGVKGVEIGSGFEAAARLGSENNDQMDENGFLSNHAGGILGGISSGQSLLARLAVKPTPSISRPQSTRDLSGRQREIEIKGRHDPCLCPRVGPVAEAMAALVLADACLCQRALQGESK